MSTAGYIWRKLTPEQREQILAWRQERRKPWHSPPHRAGWFGLGSYHVTAACYEHAPYIGLSPDRMDEFSAALVDVLTKSAERLYAWSVLPNHYHALVRAPAILGLLTELGRLHGRSSFRWNGEEGTRGRKIFFRAVEREMRSAPHYFATLNYVHHQPVHHGYVETWGDWRWGSAVEYLKLEGATEAERIWRGYPVMGYGKGWDEAVM